MIDISIILTLIITMGFLFTNKRIKINNKLLSATNWEKLRMENPEYIIIDLRTHKEFSESHIENAINIDYYENDFKEQINSLDRNQKYMIYCRSGIRSGKAAVIFQKLGFENIYDLDDGIIAYSEL